MNQNTHTTAQAKYDKTHTTGFYMKLNTTTDEDILNWLQNQKTAELQQLVEDKFSEAIDHANECNPEIINVVITDAIHMVSD